MKRITRSSNLFHSTRGSFPSRGMQEQLRKEGERMAKLMETRCERCKKRESEHDGEDHEFKYVWEI